MNFSISSALTIFFEDLSFEVPADEKAETQPQKLSLLACRVFDNVRKLDLLVFQDS